MRALSALVALVLAVSGVAAAAEPPDFAIRVKGISGDTVLQLQPTEAGGMVRADLLTRLLGGTLDSIGVGRYRMGLYGATIDLMVGSPFASYSGYTLPLLEPTRLIDGAPHVTLQLFSEIIPRFGIGILWDHDRSEVRVFQAIARRSTPLPPAGTPAPMPTVAATPVAMNTAPPGAARPATTPSTPARTLSRGYRVAVDAGHGGVDPGNPGTIVGNRRVGEAELTLAIALKLEKELQKRGVDVYMTRRTDTLIARDDRGRLANQKKADLFVSIHTNAPGTSMKNPTAVRGFETYFLSTARTEDERRVAAMENEVVRFEQSTPITKGDPLAFIMADLAQNEFLRESSELALSVQGGLSTAHPGPSRGVKQAGFAVLATAYMPAILIELGYGSNRADATWMASAAGQAAAASSIADAIIDYLHGFDRRNRASPR